MKNLLSIIFIFAALNSFGVTLDQFISAIGKVESNNNSKAIGDNGRSLGIYQIQMATFIDAKDLDEFVKTLCEFGAAIKQKDELKILWDKFKHKRMWPNWQKERVNLFFAEKSLEELVQRAYEIGKKNADDKYYRLYRKTER